ncbi:uncharacterized protein LOC126760454 isoform X1 [Bactrocera neohumeralis]|uniref:uncharacterized protein LOC126760454 isoform X1 n=1 Tax=Bactrocera neohumeralis TaxID=98809 RepID=UPI002165E318|nr:uncharacterized protein LOC126760454 isoform X1 [Bactrocera neohumeralis]
MCLDMNSYYNARTMYHMILVDTIFIIGVFAVCFYFYQQFVDAAGKNSALSEAKLKEIAKIRGELNEALENEQQNTPAKGVIVQPTWLAENGTKTPNLTKFKVEVTQQRIDEVQAIRDEISKSKAHPTENDQQVQELIKEFNTKGAGRKVLEKVVGDAQVKPSDELVGVAEPSDAADLPNVVEASTQEVEDFDMRKLQRLEVSKRRVRETLILKSIEEDFSFDLGDDVQQWAHIMHDGDEYFIGRREHNLLVVHKERAAYQAGSVLEVGQPITYLLTYSFWNDAQGQTEGIMLVAAQDRVLWYRVNNATRNIELYWQWVVGNTITGLTYFTVESKDYLIVSTNQSSHTGFYTLNIYQFQLSSREFWIAQRMQLEFPCAETTLLDTGRDLILAVPQNHTAAIYTFNPRADNTDYLRFIFKQHIASTGIESVAGFRMGGRSYIAVGGQQPQILLYQQGELVPKTILSQNFGVVQLFFPVPVRTYRDDLILLVQHYVDFSTHSLTVLETLIWDGDAFTLSIPVPCKLGAHTVYGASCMLDIQRDGGLKGAAYFRRGAEVSLIVPRHNAESGLFRLHTELLAKNSEYLDLQEIYAFLKDWVQEQDDLIAQAQVFLQTTENGVPQSQPDLSELEELQTPEFSLDAGEVGEIYVNDYRWTDEDTQIDLDLVITAIEQLEAEINSGRHRRDALTETLIFPHLKFDSLEVDELFVEQQNGDNFYVQDGVLELDGVLNVQNLRVLERVSLAKARAAFEEDLEDEDEDDEVSGIESDSFVLDGDIEFESINGMPWRDIKENMVLINEPVDLTQLEVDGEVILADKVSLTTLNSLNFPEDFLWSNGPTVSVVRAEKTFTSTLSTNAMDVEGLLNGLNASDAITLHGDQTWRGLPTFSELKVTELFQLNGTTRGRDIGKIPHNPTLQDTKQVEAICSFRELQVLGKLVLLDKYDGQPLAPLLADIVQRPADPATVINVSAKKRFTEVHMPIDFKVLDDKVNGIPLTEFVPAHTKQDLLIHNLQAYVYFANLTLSGYYDGVDIAELTQNALKIDEPESALHTNLTFENALRTDTVEVMSSLNGLPIVENYQTIFEDMHLPKAHFDQLTVKLAEIEGDINGDSNVMLDADQLTYSQAAEVPHVGDIFVDELKLAHGLETDEIQGINSSLIWSFIDDIDELPDMVLDGKVLVDHVIVTGDVHVHKLNQQRFDEDLQLTIIWLNRPNYLSNSLTFVAPLTVHGNLQVEGTYNGVDLPDFIEDMVIRAPANGTTQILAPKSFTQNVQVQGDTYVDALNGIQFTDIATKKTICNFRGSVRLLGNLYVNDLEITGALNAQPMSVFSSALRFDPAAQAFIVQGVVNFNTPQVQLQDLTVFGALNDMPDLAHFFDELVYKDKACILKGRNTFSGRVGIDKGAYIRNLNGYNLLALLANIVYVNEPQPVLIRAPLTFKGPVRAHTLLVREELVASILNGHTLLEWFTDTLRLDRPQEITKYLTFAPGSLNGNSFYASFLNDIDLSQIVTLHTAQNLTGNITFSELNLNGQIHVKGAINGVDLQKEYENTLMKHGNQIVNTPLTLQSALVRKTLKTNAPINNDKDLQQLATLYGDQHFESTLYFENVAAQELKTKYHVSGINMDKWFENVLRVRDKPQQFITGNWSARILTVNSGPTLPSYMTAGRRKPLNFGALLRNAREDADYVDLCAKFRTLVKSQQKRGYHLKYLERAFELDMHAISKEQMSENLTIKAAFVLEKASDNYLLINTGERTHVMKWKAHTSKYESVVDFVAGQLDQAVTVDDTTTITNTVDFVTNKAGVEGTLNSWRLTGTQLTLLKTFEKPATDLWLSAHAPPKLYAVHDDTVYGYNLGEQAPTSTWLLPNWLGNASYRFVPHHSQALMLSNGEVILLYNDDTDDDEDALNARGKRTTLPRYSLPLYYQRVLSPQANKLSGTVLKPNATESHIYHFADFRNVILQVLDDLDYRLRLEVNITQLSIPETDLHDEHLVPDFIAIMEALREQQIYPNASFEQLEWHVHELPENPAQILAARTVQILWPHIVDMAEIQGYLATNVDETDMTVATIVDNLGTTVRDVLILANSKEQVDELIDDNAMATHALELSLVIERVRALQRYLRNTARTLRKQLLEEVAVVTTTEAPTDDGFEMFASATSDNNELVQRAIVMPPNFSELLIANATWLKFYSKNLPALGKGEILPITVLTQQTPLELLAVTLPAPQLVGAHQAEIVLYLDVLSGTRFQTITALQPRSLITMQIVSETLFAYVEDCCTVRVLAYRGVEGFVEFTRFKSAERVLKVFSVMLQGSDILVTQPHLAVALADRVVFYRFVGAGASLRVPTNFICS